MGDRVDGRDNHPLAKSPSVTVAWASANKPECLTEWPQPYAGDLRRSHTLGARSLPNLVMCS